jgi:uncharacterized membrane protein YfcA
MPTFTPGSTPTLDDLPALLALSAVGAIASGINAVAGGGSLLTFPALVGFGAPALYANATSSLAMWPGSLAGALGYVRRLPKVRGAMRALLLPSALGGAIGALLLVYTTERAFKLVVPVLVFGATILLALQPRIKAWSLRRERRISMLTGALLQLAVSVYGGYFGAGMGILMLAVFGLITDGDIHELNAMKNVLGLLINLVASVLFIVQGLVLWAGLAIMVGAITGGYLSAKYSQRLDAEKLRKGIVALGLAMTAWFTLRVLRP